MSELLEKCTAARDAAQKLISTTTEVKDAALEAIADAIVMRADEIIVANEKDIAAAKKMEHVRLCLTALH